MEQTLKITLATENLLCMLPLVAVNDIRYYLNGILLEAKNGEFKLVATDGHRMLVQRIESPVIAGEWGDVEIILPRMLVEGIKKWKMPNVTLEIGKPQKNGVVEIKIIGDMVLTDKSVDGKFSDWRRSFPGECSGIPAEYNADLIVGFTDASMILAKTKKVSQRAAHHPRITPNGKQPAMVTFNNANLVGLLMSFRDKDESSLPYTQPSWLAISSHIKPHLLEQKDGRFMLFAHVELSQDEISNAGTALPQLMGTRALEKHSLAEQIETIDYEPVTVKKGLIVYEVRVGIVRQVKA